ncbi:MAG: S41 family peptidase [Phenylobacterium sp.]
MSIDRLAGLVAALLLIGAPVAAQVPPGAVPETAFDQATVKADFAALYGTLEASHYDLYARTPKAAYDRAFGKLDAEIEEPMTRAQTVALYQRFMAVGGIAHARIDEAGAAFSAYRKAGGAAFPLAVRVVGERLYVVRNESGFADLAAGDEILALNGRTAGQWLAFAPTEVSADTPYMLGAMMEWSFPRVLWSALGATPDFELRLRRPGRPPFTAVVPARTVAEMAAAAARLPPTLNLSWEKREARMLGDGVVYLRPGPTYNVEGDEASMYDNRAFKAFIDQSFESFLAAGAKDLILDLRDNPGGDNSFSDLMVAWFANRPFRFNARFRIKVSPATIASNRARLDVAGNDPTGISAAMAAAYRDVAPGAVIDFPIPETRPRAGQQFEGRVYALINRHSYSNTVAIAATLQDNRFATILGEETSDLATTYGAMERFTLPRTAIAVGYPKALIVRPNGDLRARGVVPDIPIPTPVLEGADDPVLQSALKIVLSRRPR